MYSFLNDYSEGAHKNVLKAIIKTNFEQTEGYGIDGYCDEAARIIKGLVGNECSVHFLPGGTVTNTVAASAFLKPYEGVIAADTGHIAVHETGAIEATGHKIITVESSDGKITAEQVDSVAGNHFADFYKEHTVKPKMVYISQPTELGTVYSKAELEAIREVCDRYDMYLYVDGARLGAALAYEKNDVTLEDLGRLTTAFYIGGTKMGALFGEALVINDEALSVDFRYNIKQNGAMIAKGRLMGIQFIELLKDGLYVEIGKRENRIAAVLAKKLSELGIEFAAKQETNQVFPIFSNELIESLEEDYAFEIWGDNDEDSKVVRLCTSFATSERKTGEFIEAVRAFMKPEEVQTEEAEPVEEEAVQAEEVSEESAAAETAVPLAAAAGAAGLALAGDDDEDVSDENPEEPETVQYDDEENEPETDEVEEDEPEEDGDDETEEVEEDEPDEEDEDDENETEEDDESEAEEDDAEDDDSSEEAEESAGDDAWNSYLSASEEPEAEEKKESWDDFLNRVEPEEEKEDAKMSWDDYTREYSDEEPAGSAEETPAADAPAEEEEVFEETEEAAEEPEPVPEEAAEVIEEEPVLVETEEEPEVIGLQDLEVEEDDDDGEIVFEELEIEDAGITEGADQKAPEIVLEDISEDEFSDIDIVSELDTNLEINVEGDDYSDIIDTINLSDDVIEEMKTRKEAEAREEEARKFETRPIGDISDTITNREFIKTVVKEIEDVEPIKVIDEDDGMFEFEFED